ncbi:hypothetical protein JK359_04195 [Streptomyces actinomycinicus]|uniref:DUF6542 domain-containing protein n=1 Tax=Streptomyces actinomycinicus TaxID=1695166 RepID=A0A937EFH4_9ACTN|nr:DUF6542 domain-containing protein [Streptomyces actinomycinicus]MBL1081184.1 hypothetical protein [Streptomyces actinomycinicus]
MEQHRSRPPNDGPRRGTPPAPLPPQARRRPGGEGRAAPGAARPARAARTARPARAGGRPAGAGGRPARAGGRPAGAGGRLPNPRLTGLGGGLFCILAMCLLGYLDQLLFGASLTAYGVLFLPVCVLTALWVRAGDVLTAPVVVPIAFAAGLLPVAGGSAGLAGRLMGLFTGLATQAGWLYGGTLAAGVIVLVRRVQWVRQQRRRD